MKTSHVVGVVAGVGALGALFYLGTKGTGAAKAYYPGAQGIPTNRVGGAPQNANPATPSNSTAQIIAASGGAAVALLPAISSLWASDGGDPADEPTGSTEGLSAFDAQGI